MFIRIDAVHISCNEDTLALRHAFRLYDKVHFGIFLLVKCYLIFEFIQLVWEEPSLWKELVIFGKLSFHFLQIPCKIILSCYLKHSRKVVNALVRFDLVKALEWRCNIRPLNVPFGASQPRVPLTHYSPTKDLSAYFFDHIILRIYCKMLMVRKGLTSQKRFFLDYNSYLLKALNTIRGGFTTTC